jgi:hypothetical protein
MNIYSPYKFGNVHTTHWVGGGGGGGGGGTNP